MVKIKIACSRRHGIAYAGLIWMIGCISMGAWLLTAGLHPQEEMPPPVCTVAAPPTPRYITKNIEDIQVGDYVLAKDPGESGPPTPHKVLALPRNWTEHVVHVLVQGGGEVVATRMHPFWVEGQGWTDAKDLKPGELLRDENNRAAAITSVRVADRRADTFNLTIEGVHTYYVLAGTVPVLVHNNTIPLLPAPGQGMSAVNIGGEGEVPGVLNVQPNTAWNNPSWQSAGSSGFPGATIEQLEQKGIPFVRYTPGTQLPFADNSIGQVITNGVPFGPNIYGTPANEDEVRRILQPGGTWWRDRSPYFTKACP